MRNHASKSSGNAFKYFGEEFYLIYGIQQNKKINRTTRTSYRNKILNRFQIEINNSNIGLKLFKLNKILKIIY